MKIVKYVVVAGLLMLTGCGSDQKLIAPTVNSTSTSTTSSTSTTTTAAPTLSAAAVQAKVQKFYMDYANVSPATQSDADYFAAIKKLEADNLDQSLIDQLAKAAPTVDYDQVACGQNTSPDVTVKVTRVDNGTYDATVTPHFSGGGDPNIAVTGAADTGRIHTIKCPS